MTFIISNLSSVWCCPCPLTVFILHFLPLPYLYHLFPICYHVILITIKLCPLWMCWMIISWGSELREIDWKESEKERESNYTTQKRRRCLRERFTITWKTEKTDTESVYYSKWKYTQLRDVKPVYLLPMHLSKPSPLLYISFTSRQHYKRNTAHTADTQVPFPPNTLSYIHTDTQCPFSLCLRLSKQLSLFVRVIDRHSCYIYVHYVSSKCTCVHLWAHTTPFAPSALLCPHYVPFTSKS